MKEYGVDVSTGQAGMSSAVQKGKMLPVAAILAAVLFWGGSFAAMRAVLKVLNPWTVMWLRMVLALILLLPLSGKLIPVQYRRGDWKLLTTLVLFQPCLYFLLEANALRFTTASQAGIIAASVPLMVALGAWLLLSESIGPKAVAGIALSITGVAGLTFLGGEGGQAENPVLGNTLELAAMASAAGYILLVKQLSQRYNPWSLTAMQVGAGSIFFLPGLYYLLQADQSVWTLDLFLSMLYLGSFVTVGAFGLYNWGVSQISATGASTFLNLVPAWAVFFGWGLLGESLTSAQIMSAGVVILGVWLSQKKG